MTFYVYKRQNDRNRVKIIVDEMDECKLWCSEHKSNRNGVSVIMNERTSNDVVEVCRKNDRINY